ncbi:chromate transporter [Streptomyces sp. HMX87]|uniref:chromate transporter n=1 Tax=Streptomyces sp. HMX87 TaxID=3390849 RepID=UPI003A899BAA
MAPLPDRPGPVGGTAGCRRHPVRHQQHLTDQSLFFSGTALVTFGGAYAVLTYVAQQAVQTCGRLSPGEMVRGLALAELLVTPGPLIMVLRFVTFLGAYRAPGPLSPGPPPCSAPC